MRKSRFEGLLAGTAVALALALSPYASGAFAATEAELSAAVPTPASADLPPPGADDIAPVPSAVPIPASADLPPPSARDIAPAQSAAPIDDISQAAKAAAPARDATSSVPVPSNPKAVTFSVADSPIVDKLREQLAAGKYDRILGSRKERQAIEAFYASREFAPLWITDGAINARGKAAVAYLSRIESEGLDPTDYPLPEIKAGAEPEALAEAEIRFTDSVMTFARHAQMGRVHFSRVASDILFNPVKPEPADVLGKLAEAKDAGAALDNLNPQQPGYKALKAKLAELRNGAPDVAKPVISSGPVLKYVQGKKDKKGKETTQEVVMEDPRVPALRAWFSLPASEGDTTYDKALSETIAKFQKEHNLPATGQLTQATLDVMNGPKRERTIDIVLANMERWRWLPRDLGRTHIMVNIPDFTLRVMRDNKLVWKTKIVVGKPSLPTPITTAAMKYITVNPTWNVPPSIIQNEYLPALQQDPQAMERIGLRVEQNPDGTVRIWQPPGDRNALGRIRFNFPNKFLVYQHDTPDKHLFAHDKRAYSHGCMRVQDPLKYGEVLLSLVLPNEHYTAERLQKMFGGSEININFPQFLPVHLTYQTAFVDDGKLIIRDDVYGRDARMLPLLKGSERKVADIAIDRPRGSSSTPVRMPPGTFGGGPGWGGGPSFFDRLFGAPEPRAPRPRAQVGRANDRGYQFR
jgi:murein L,D-transpeptidase YcbB/YkuD